MNNQPDKRQFACIIPWVSDDTIAPLLNYQEENISPNSFFSKIKFSLIRVPINDCIYFFNNIKIYFIICIFYTRFSPWNT